MGLAQAVKQRVASPLRITAEVFGLAAVLMALLLVAIRVRCGSWELVVPYLRGERLIVLDREIDLGEQPPGAVVERDVRIANLAARAVTVLGAYRSCHCLALETFPFTIRPGAERALRIRVALPSTKGKYEGMLKLFTDHVQSGRFVVRIVGNVTDSADELTTQKLVPIPDSRFGTRLGGGGAAGHSGDVELGKRKSADGSFAKHEERSLP